MSIKTFRCADTEAVFGFRRVARFVNIERPALRKLKQLDPARRIEDLRAPPAQRIGEILSGKRSVSADTDLRLCRFFGLSDGWWLRLQADHHTEVARAALAKTLAKIKPWSAAPVASARDYLKSQ